MNSPEKCAPYLRDLGTLIKEYAQEAKRERAAQDGPNEDLYRAGEIAAYGRIISLMQQQARAFDIPLRDLDLDDIDVERDLLSASEPPETDLFDRSSKSADANA